MSLTITQTNPIGFVGIPQDDLEAITDPTELSYYIPSVYEGQSFSVDFTFTYTFSLLGVPLPPVPPVSVSYDQSGTNTGITISNVGAGIRVSGTPTNVFQGSFYRFVMQDMTTRILPSTTTENYLHLIEYQMPSNTVQLREFPITLRFTDPNTSAQLVLPINIRCYFYWVTEAATSSIRSLLDRRK